MQLELSLSERSNTRLILTSLQKDISALLEIIWFGNADFHFKIRRNEQYIKRGELKPKVEKRRQILRIYL